MTIKNTTMTKFSTHDRDYLKRTIFASLPSEAPLRGFTRAGVEKSVHEFVDGMTDKDLLDRLCLALVADAVEPLSSEESLAGPYQFTRDDFYGMVEGHPSPWGYLDEAA